MSFGNICTTREGCGGGAGGGEERTRVRAFLSSTNSGADRPCARKWPNTRGSGGEKAVGEGEGEGGLES